MVIIFYIAFYAVTYNNDFNFILSAMRAHGDAAASIPPSSPGTPSSSIIFALICSIY